MGRRCLLGACQLQPLAFAPSERHSPQLPAHTPHFQQRIATPSTTPTEKPRINSVTPDVCSGQNGVDLGQFVCFGSKTDKLHLNRALPLQPPEQTSAETSSNVCVGPEAVVMAPAQSPSPGLGEKYLSNFPVSSQWSRASFGMSFLAVMFGHFCAYSRLRLSHFSRPGSVSA